MNIVKIINKEIIELKKILNDIDNKDLKVLDLLCEESKKAIKKKTRYFFVEMEEALRMHNT